MVKPTGLLLLLVLVELSNGQDIVAHMEQDGSIAYNGQTYVLADLAAPKVPMVLKEEIVFPPDPAFYENAGLAVACVCFAALAAGLTMGLVSIEPMQLQIILGTDPSDCNTDLERTELEKNKKYASAIQPLVHKHHLLLVTLLLINSASNEALPLFLDRVVPSYVAIILSVTFVLFFGEIIPSAIFTGPGQLKIAARFAPVVKFFIAILFPIAFPISWLLDKCLGEDHGSRYKHAELKALVSLQQGAVEDLEHAGGLNRSHNKNQHGIGHSGLSTDEVTIIHGALAMKKLTVGDVMIPLNEVFMLGMDAMLDADTMASIIASGHSRIPVFDAHPHNIRGILLVKRLIVLDPEDRRKLSTLGLRKPIMVSPDLPLLELLNEFQKGKSHLAIVCNSPKDVRKAHKFDSMIPPNVHMAGIITIEDVIETLIQEQIYDESDNSMGVRQRLTKHTKVARRLGHLRRLVADEKEGHVPRTDVTEDRTIIKDVYTPQGGTHRRPRLSLHAKDELSIPLLGGATFSYSSTEDAAAAPQARHSVPAPPARASIDRSTMGGSLFAASALAAARLQAMPKKGSKDGKDGQQLQQPVNQE